MADLEAVRGDTNIYEITVLRENLPVDITNAKIWFTVKNNKTDDDGDAVIAKNTTDHNTQVVKLSPATAGKVQLILSHDDTKDFTSDQALYYDVQMRELNGVLTTVASGIFRVKLDVTVAST